MHNIRFWSITEFQIKCYKIWAPFDMVKRVEFEVTKHLIGHIKYQFQQKVIMTIWLVVTMVYYELRKNWKVKKKPVKFISNVAMITSKCVKPRQMSKKVTIPVFHVGVCFIYVTNYVMTIKLRNLMVWNTSLCANIKNDATANLPESKFAMEYVSSQLKCSATHPKKKHQQSPSLHKQTTSQRDWMLVFECMRSGASI